MDIAARQGDSMIKLLRTTLGRNEPPIDHVNPNGPSAVNHINLTKTRVNTQLWGAFIANSR
jgi:hypothetical protein